MDSGSLLDVREDLKIDNATSYSIEDVSSSTFTKLKPINNLQNLVKTMKSESENLPSIAQNTVGETFQNVDGSMIENISQHLLLTSLIDIFAFCKESINLMQNNVERHLLSSTGCSTSAKLQEQMKNEYHEDEHVLVKVPVDIVQALIGILPHVFSKDSQLGEELKELAGKCDSCACELKTVCIIIQKMFLMSLGGNSQEMKYSIDERASSLLSIEQEKDPCPSINDDDSCLSESISSIYLLPSIGDSCSFGSDCDDIKSSEDFKSLEFDFKENGASPRRVNMAVPRQFLKITHIENQYSSDEFCNEESETEDIGGNHFFLLDLNSCTPLRSPGKNYNGSKQACKDKTSLSSFPRHKTPAKQQPEVQSKISSNSSKSKVTGANEKSQNIQNTLSKPTENFVPNSHPSIDKESSHPNSRRTSSSFTDSSSFGHSEGTSIKIRTDMVEVKMANSGEGFGLILAIKYNSTRTSIVPVIHSIRPKSPAQKCGVLKVDDRITSINHRTTLGLTPNELRALSKQSFCEEGVVLKVEFDVVEEKPKFGTFDIILDKTLKIGLVFEDIRRGFPMLVSGIVKGSGAHRCGQLYPGDKIKFFRCVRNEEFDPVSCHYTKEESVLITVRREPPAEDLGEKLGTGPPCYINPCFSHVDSVPRRGKSYVVRNTKVHAVAGTEALVLDQELILFRDPVFWDFGFLVGENPESGRAYVTDVRPEGPAAQSGAVKKFDRIVQVNGVLVDGNVENSVLALLSQANHKVELLTRRLYREEKTV